MHSTLEERVDQLEKKVVELSKHAPDRNAWKKTFGLAKGDEGFEEMVRLGSEYRKNLAIIERADS